MPLAALCSAERKWASQQIALESHNTVTWWERAAISTREDPNTGLFCPSQALVLVHTLLQHIQEISSIIRVTSNISSLGHHQFLLSAADVTTQLQVIISMYTMMVYFWVRSRKFVLKASVAVPHDVDILMYGSPP